MKLCVSGSGESIIKDPEVKARELFISKANATDTFPISQLRYVMNYTVCVCKMHLFAGYVLDLK